MNRITRIFLLSSIFVLISATFAYARSSEIPNIFEIIISEIESGDLKGAFLSKSRALYMCLATMYFTWSVTYELMRSYNTPYEAILFGAFRTLVCCLIFGMFIKYSWGLIITPLGDFFSQLLGEKATISALITSLLKCCGKPYTVFTNYLTNGHFEIEGQLLTVTGILKALKGLAEFLLLPLILLVLGLLATICMIIILIASTQIVMVAIVAKVDLYLTQLFAILALAFWGAPYTRDIAMAALRAVVAAAIRLTVIYTLGGVALKVCNKIVSISALNTSGPIDCIYLMLEYAMGMLILSSLFQTVPTHIASIFGSVTGSYAAPVGTGVAVTAAKAGAKAAIGV